MEKDFDHWNSHKKKVNDAAGRPFYHAREIWWCAVGVNVGNELEGTGKEHDRPVLVIRPFNAETFFGVALIGHPRIGRYYFPLGFPENLRNNLARTERVQLDTNGATVACLRLDDKIRWCYEHIAPVGAQAEMLRIRNEPVPGLLVGQLYHYVDDFDLDGTVDLGSTTLLQGEPHAPVGVVSQFFYRGTGIAATNFVVTIRSSMTTASKSRSSTWANSIF